MPDPNSAVVSTTGQTYDTALGLYLDNVFMQVPNDPRVEASINATAKKLDGLRRDASTAKLAAMEDFYRDCPNGIDPFTNKECDLQHYAEVRLTPSAFS